MDLLIPNSWLKKYLNTKASPQEIAKYLSLCGPSIERTNKTENGDFIYNVEVTTNRVDSASVLGVAREASAILPRFGITAKLKFTDQKENGNFKFVKKVKYLNVSVNSKLCPRFTAILINDVTVRESPNDVKVLLEKVGVRSINNVVDVSNLIMHEIGQPVHTFDYDKIGKHKMILRESRKGETLTTLDEKTHILFGGDIVIEDGSKKLIDLCGIMGGKESAIDNNTKNVLLFVQNYNPKRIRETSMRLAHRTEAAVLFEKQIDPELVTTGILKSIELLEKLSYGTAQKEVLDLYPHPYKTKIIKISKERIDKSIGISIDMKDIVKYTESLGFKVQQQDKTMLFSVPSWRANDISIPEDIIEEVARIHGYHNLPSQIMTGAIPQQNTDSPFAFEKEIKQTLRSLGFIEVYNLSLVSKEMISGKALRLKNSLGTDGEYLRTSLKNSLLNAVRSNSHEKQSINMFEMANIYLPRKNDLPNEQMTLSGVITKESYRLSKGKIETLLDELKVKYTTKITEGNEYLPSQKTEVWADKEIVGEYGNLDTGEFFFEFNVEKLRHSQKEELLFQEISKFPPQVEDLTLVIPEKTFIGEVVNSVKTVTQLINKIELSDIFENAYTFNIQYQAKDRTLTDKEVKDLRNKILLTLKSKFGITTKD